MSSQFKQIRQHQFFTAWHHLTYLYDKMLERGIGEEKQVRSTDSGSACSLAKYKLPNVGWWSFLFTIQLFYIYRHLQLNIHNLNIHIFNICAAEMSWNETFLTLVLVLFNKRLHNEGERRWGSVYNLNSHAGNTLSQYEPIYTEGGNG